MKLPHPFYRLPLRFDARRLREEVDALPLSAWHAHPTDFEGNSSVRLISVGGGENDEVTGQMQPTAHLTRMPYVQQILARFGVVWSRSRLMRLGPGNQVPEHADINLHWYYRVRVHIPVITRPEVRFFCGTDSVHMAAGEAWVFDNWRRHRVENNSPEQRIHLVADTSGSAGFWQSIAMGMDPATAPRSVSYEPGRAVRLLCERHNSSRVMPAAEVELLLGDLRGELHLAEDGEASRPALARFRILLDDFCREWRQLWSLYGDSPQGVPDFSRLRDAMRAQAAAAAGSITARANNVPILKVLEARVLQHAVNAGAAPLQVATPTPSGIEAGPAPAAARTVAATRFDRPVFIVSAPRSGSTLLFETLSRSGKLWTVGGEAHWLVESLPEFRPDGGRVDSNRLTAEHYSEAIGEKIRAMLAAELRDANGERWGGTGDVRVLEKTPKNSLRIPFLERAFPGARFIFLWRDPRENISSIMQAWRAGKWVTYPELAGWDGPWSLLLPPGWASLRGKPLEEIAAFQWDAANRTILGDLRRLPADRWAVANYSELVARPAPLIERLCRFAGIEMDETLAARLASPLPLSRFTDTPPAPGKWRQNAAAVERVLPSVELTWQALRKL